jgi:molybdate transport system permease protein
VSGAPAPPPARPWAGALLRIGAGAGIALLAALVALPLVAMVLRVEPAVFVARLAEPVVLEALRLSLVTSLAATLMVVALGLPFAWWLSAREFPGKRVVEVLILLPMVLPPTVGGFALLLAFGRMGLAGGALEACGVVLPFTTLGAVVAQAFMAAPFFVTAARAGFEGVDARHREVASTLRASEARTFFTVVLPLSRPALAAGTAMAAARALGEFGATITFAGNRPGVTQTMPLAVYVEMQSDLDAALVLSVLLLGMSAGLLLALRSAPRGMFGGRR